MSLALEGRQFTPKGHEGGFSHPRRPFGGGSPQGLQNKNKNCSKMGLALGVDDSSPKIMGVAKDGSLGVAPKGQLIFFLFFVFGKWGWPNHSQGTKGGFGHSKLPLVFKQWWPAITKEIYKFFIVFY